MLTKEQRTKILDNVFAEHRRKNAFENWLGDLDEAIDAYKSFKFGKTPENQKFKCKLEEDEYRGYYEKFCAYYKTKLIETAQAINEIKEFV